MSSQVLAATRNARFELHRHPSYSPEVTPIDFYFFSKLKVKEFMKECKFTDDKDVVCAKMASWKSKINNSSTMEFELWRNKGPSAFQLQEIMLKSDKI